MSKFRLLDGPSQHRLPLLYGGWWKWQKECGRGTFPSSHLFLMVRIHHRAWPTARRVRKWPVAGQPPPGYDCVLWTRRKDGSGQASRCHGRNWKCTCDIYCVYHLTAKEQGRSFHIELNLLKLCLHPSVLVLLFPWSLPWPSIEDFPLCWQDIMSVWMLWIPPHSGHLHRADVPIPQLLSTPAAPVSGKLSLDTLKTPCLRGQLAFS